MCPGTLGVKRILWNGILPLFLLISSPDLPSPGGSQALSCLSAPLVTFSNLYIQNEIPKLRECTMWPLSPNLEGTLPLLQGFSTAHWDLPCMISFLPPLPILLPHTFFIVIPHFSYPLHLILGQDFNLLFDLFSAPILGKVQIVSCSLGAELHSRKALHFLKLISLINNAISDVLKTIIVKKY